MPVIPAAHVLAPWSNFYVMIGSSAAALTGLMFVVISLVTGSERARAQSSDGVSTYSTPTVVHFGTALFAAAVLSAPWPTLVVPATLLGLVGLFGVSYVIAKMIKATQLRAYQPDLEDWAWFTIFPILAYAGFIAGALLLPFQPVHAMFAPAGASTLLIFIGIHNAWDVVTFLTIRES